MRYKLINKITNEKTICVKIVIDEFDYYANDETGKVNDFITNGIAVAQINILTVDDPNKHLHKKIIATNNPNINLPQVIDQIKTELLAEEYIKTEKDFEFEQYSEYQNGKFNGFIDGYNKSQETHSFSEENMIEFGQFCIVHKNILRNFPDIITKELLNLWKEQQLKTIYY